MNDWTGLGDLETWKLPGTEEYRATITYLAGSTLTWTRSRLCFGPNHIAGQALYWRTLANSVAFAFASKTNRGAGQRQAFGSGGYVQSYTSVVRYRVARVP